MTTCTVRTASGICGEPAVYTEVSRLTGEMLGECSEHSRQHGSLYLTRHLLNHSAVEIGSFVSLKAYGGTYYGRVMRVGRKLADVRITLQTGREKVLKDRPIGDLHVRDQVL
jgi:hypothetical protein